jgi:hypothetical protein
VSKPGALGAAAGVSARFPVPARAKARAAPTAAGSTTAAATMTVRRSTRGCPVSGAAREKMGPERGACCGSAGSSAGESTAGGGAWRRPVMVLWLVTAWSSSVNST